MKKTLFIFTLLLTLTSCTVELTESAFLGSWQVTHFKSNIEDLSPALVNAATKEALSWVYTFNQGGDCILKSEDIPEGERGTFELTVEENTVRITRTNSDSNPQEYVITSFRGNKMIWQQDIPGMGSFEMTLKRI